MASLRRPFVVPFDVHLQSPRRPVAAPPSSVHCPFPVPSLHVRRIVVVPLVCLLCPSVVRLPSLDCLVVVSSLATFLSLRCSVLVLGVPSLSTTDVCCRPFGVVSLSVRHHFVVPPSSLSRPFVVPPASLRCPVVFLRRIFVVSRVCLRCPPVVRLPFLRCLFVVPSLFRFVPSVSLRCPPPSSRRCSFDVRLLSLRRTVGEPLVFLHCPFGVPP